MNDTATKKPVVISVTPDSEVKKLDPAVAQRLAARMNGGGARRPEGSAALRSRGGPQQAPLPDHLQAAPGRIGRQAVNQAVQGRGSGFDVQQLLARSPSVALKDLSKGNMVIVVATEGQAPDTATAITVVAGVEPMLQASTSASQAMLSSAWNLGGGGGGEGGGEAPGRAIEHSM